MTDSSVEVAGYIEIKRVPAEGGVAAALYVVQKRAITKGIVEKTSGVTGERSKANCRVLASEGRSTVIILERGLADGGVSRAGNIVGERPSANSGV